MKRYRCFSIMFALLVAAAPACTDRPETGPAAGASSPQLKESGGGAFSFMDYGPGMARARKENKVVMINFYADWCQWCKTLENETLRSPEVSEKLSRDYVSIRINTDGADSQTITYKDRKFSAQDFAGYMNVEGLPSTVFLESDGTYIYKLAGYVEKDMFLPLLGYIADRCYAKKVPFEDYIRNGNLCKG